MTLIKRIANKLPNSIKMNINLIRKRITYNQDGIMTIHNTDWINEPKFKTAYEKAVKEGLYVDKNIQWRSYITCWAGEQVKELEGDYVECGVNKGFLSRILAEYINLRKTKKKLYLLDTYEGIDLTQLNKKEKTKINNELYKPIYEITKQAFKDYPNAILIKGIIPKTLKQVKTKKICYLSIDLNNARPEIETINHFWNKIVCGGIIILDDYGWLHHEEQKKAFDKFAKEKNIRILPLPTGQGIIIKKEEDKK